MKEGTHTGLVKQTEDDVVGIGSDGMVSGAKFRIRFGQNGKD